MQIEYLEEMLKYISDGFQLSTERIKSCGFIDFVRGKEGIALDFHGNGLVRSRTFTLDGHGHRDSSEGPAYERWTKQGTLAYRLYLSNGATHRPSQEGPAVEHFYDDGSYFAVSFYERDVLSRPAQDGPAYTQYDPDGKIVKEQYRLT